MNRRLQEAPIQFHEAQNFEISVCESYYFHPQAIDLI